jgi:hypothetical protein
VKSHHMAIVRVMAWLCDDPLPAVELRSLTLARFNAYAASRDWRPMTGRRLALALREMGAVTDDDEWQMDPDTVHTARVWVRA